MHSKQADVVGRSRRWLAPALLVVAVVVLSAWATSSPPVWTTDSAGYLSAAENVAGGRGPTSAVALASEVLGPRAQVVTDHALPMSEWPPLYPTLVGVAKAAGLPMDGAVRLVNGVSLAGVVLGTAVLGWLVAGRRWGGVVLGAVMAFSAPAFAAGLVPGSPLAMAGWVLTETLFVGLAVWALVAGAYAVVSRRRPAAIAFLVLVVAACLTRYVGVALGAAGGAAWLIWTRTTLRNRVLGAAFALGAAAGTVVVWTIVNSLVWDAHRAKTLRWHPPEGEQLASGVRVLTSWFGLRDAAPMGWHLALLAVLVAGPVGWALTRTPTNTSRGSLGYLAPVAASICAYFVVAYLAVLVTTMALLDRVVDLDGRTLLPLQPALITTVVFAGYSLAASRGQVTRSVGRSVAGVWVAIGVVLALAAPILYPRARHLIESMASAQRADVLDSPLRPLAGATPVFSNDPAELSLFSGIDSYLLPPRTYLTSGLTNTEWGEQLATAGSILRADEGLIILVQASDLRLDPSQVAQGTGLQVVTVCPGGEVVLGVPGSDLAVAARQACGPLAEPG